MKSSMWSLILAAGLMGTGFAQKAAPEPSLTGFPFTNESLSYTVNWPSGLSLGEGHMTATREISGWRFDFAVDASVPGFEVKDAYHSTSDTDYCSQSLSKDSTHGKRKNNETISIDKDTATVTRHLSSGATSKATVAGCVRDALTFVYYARRELGQGRVPAPEKLVFGAMYDTSLSYAGAETITVNDKRVLTDKIVVHAKGPASDVQFEAYFDRDPARTPVSIRVPLPIGKFSLELVR